MEVMNDWLSVDGCRMPIINQVAGFEAMMYQLQLPPEISEPKNT